MAKPIMNIVKPVVTTEQQNAQSLETLMQTVADHADGLKEAAKLIQELHDSGILEALTAILQAKETIAKIAVGQMLRPNVTNMINNAMAAAGKFSEIDPKTTEKLVHSVANGLEKAELSLSSGEKVGVLDLFKILKDPDINRAITFGVNLLKGFGEGLQE